MPQPLPHHDATIEERLAGIEEALRRAEEREGRVLELLRLLINRQHAMSETRLLSKRHAARLIGVSRTRTLDAAIASGEVRVVQKGKRVAIPRSEVERVMRDGLLAANEPMKRTRARRPATPATVTVGDAVAYAKQRLRGR